MTMPKALQPEVYVPGKTTQKSAEGGAIAYGVYRQVWDARLSHEPAETKVIASSGAVIRELNCSGRRVLREVPIVPQRGIRKKLMSPFTCRRGSPMPLFP